MLKNPGPLQSPSIFILQLFLLHGNGFNVTQSQKIEATKISAQMFKTRPPSFPFFRQTNHGNLNIQTATAGRTEMFRDTHKAVRR